MQRWLWGSFEQGGHTHMHKRTQVPKWWAAWPTWSLQHGAEKQGEGWTMDTCKEGRETQENRRLKMIKTTIGSLNLQEVPLGKRGTVNYWRHNKMSLGWEKENTTLFFLPFHAEPVITEPKKSSYSQTIFHCRRESYLQMEFVCFFLLISPESFHLTESLPLLIPAILANSLSLAIHKTHLF